MKLLKRQEKILTDYVNLHGDLAESVFDDLPSTVQAALVRVKEQETLWCDAERFINDLKVKRMIERRGRF